MPIILIFCAHSHAFACPPFLRLSSRAPLHCSRRLHLRCHHHPRHAVHRQTREAAPHLRLGLGRGERVAAGAVVPVPDFAGLSRRASGQRSGVPHPRFGRCVPHHLDQVDVRDGALGKRAAGARGTALQMGGRAPKGAGRHVASAPARDSQPVPGSWRV